MSGLCVRSAAVLAMVALSVAAFGRAAWSAEKVVEPFNGKNLDGWIIQGDAKASQWTVGCARLDPKKPKEFQVAPCKEGPGELVNAKLHGVDIYTAKKFGDATIDLEFMVPQGSNSGIYPMGEYEVQVLDSFGRQTLSKGDCGAVYGVSAPRVNASKKPGQWQHIVIEFRAPRFQDGKKVANAKFVKVTLNGQVIQENVEVAGPTGGGITGREAPTGPLKFQGNHGVVSFRNIKITVPGEE